MSLIAIYSILGVLALVIGLVSRWWLFRTGKKIGRQEERTAELERHINEGIKSGKEAKADLDHARGLSDDDIDDSLRGPKHR